MLLSTIGSPIGSAVLTPVVGAIRAVGKRHDAAPITRNLGYRDLLVTVVVVAVLAD